MTDALPLVGVMIGGVLTWATTEWSRRQAQKSEWSRVRREKLEEVMAALAFVERQAVQIGIAEARRYQGEQVEPGQPLNLESLSTRLTIYFPETRGVVEAHAAREHEARQGQLARLKKAVLNGDHKVLDSVALQAAVEVSVEVGLYARELRPVLDQVASALARP